MSEYICPHCKKPVYDEYALLCLYCGESLDRAAGLFGKLRHPRPKIILAATLLLVILSFILLMIR